MGTKITGQPKLLCGDLESTHSNLESTHSKHFWPHMSGVIFSIPSMWKIMKILLGPCCTKCYQYIANFGTENAVKAWLQSSRKKHRSLRWCWIAARITNIGRKYDCPVSTCKQWFRSFFMVEPFSNAMSSDDFTTIQPFLCFLTTTRNLFLITRMRILQASTCPFLFVACAWLQGIACWQILLASKKGGSPGGAVDVNWMTSD